MRSSRRLLPLVIPALLVTVAGCGGSESATERAIEEAAGGDVDVELSEDGEVVQIETEDGSFSTGQEIPDDFPSEVPYDEDWTVQSSTNMSGSDGTLWMVTFLTDENPKDVFADVRALYTGAGFTESQVMESSSADGYGSIASFEGKGYEVFVSIGEDTTGEQSAAIVLNVTPSAG